MIDRELEQIEKKIFADKFTTAMKKVQFSNSIKKGLGEKIKANPNSVKLIKKPFSVRVINFIKQIFQKI